MRKTGGRHEMKHFISHTDLLQLRAKLRLIAKEDSHAKDGGYRVRSLYFDNYKDKALYEKVEGVDDREKFRLRFYDEDLSFIRLEKKSKHGGICFKESIPITQEQCRSILEGEWRTLANTQGLLLELYTKMQYQHLRPKSIVDYWREVYLYPAGNVRVTMDTDIRSSTQINTFMEPKILSLPLPGVRILEVKYDCFLPEMIRGIVSLSSRQTTAFSKYAVTRFI